MKRKRKRSTKRTFKIEARGSKTKHSLEDLVSGITDENRHAEVNRGTPRSWNTITSDRVREILEPSPLTLRAASIVLPVLRANKVTPKMIRAMLEEVSKVRIELHSKSARPNFIGYLHSIPQGPDVFDRIRAFRTRMASVPKGEAGKLVRAGGRLSVAGKQELRELGYSPKSIAAIESGLAESSAGRTLCRGSFAIRHRKRVLSPEFKKLMAKKIVGSTQEDLDAVRGDR